MHSLRAAGLPGRPALILCAASRGSARRSGVDASPSHAAAAVPEKINKTMPRSEREACFFLRLDEGRERARVWLC